MAETVKSKVFQEVDLGRLRKKLRVRPPGPVTALEVDGQVLRVVQISPRGGRPVVTRVAAQPLDLPADADKADPEVLGPAIAKALEGLRLKPGAVVMGVPRAQVVLRTLALPAIQDLREIASMVHFQVAKDLPFRADEAVIDFKISRQLPPGARGETGAPAEGAPGDAGAPARMEVLVAALKRDVVENFQQTAAAAGLKLAGLGWLSYANARCVEACGLVEGAEAVALISLRPDEIGIDVIAQQALLFSRGATIKPHHPEPADAPPAAEPPVPAETAAAETPAPGEPSQPAPPATFVDAVAIEVVRSLHSYGGMEPHKPVARLVVTGATGHEAEVAAELQERFNLPCRLLDPASALNLDRSERANAAGAISILGLGLGASDAEGLPFDFLNPKRPPVQRNLKRIRTIMGATAAAAALLLVLGVRSYYVNQRMKVFRAVQAELAAAEKKRPIYKQMRLQATTVQAWTREGRNWLEHYAYLSAILPPSEEVFVSSLSVGAQGSIRLAVQARSGEILAKLDKQLRAAGYDVKPLAITPGADRNGYNFRSNVELEVPAKMTIDLAKVQPPARPADDASLEAKPNGNGRP